MVKEPVRLKFSSVKAVVRSAMGNYQIHGAKVRFYFGFRKWDFGFYFNNTVTRNVNLLIYVHLFTIAISIFFVLFLLFPGENPYCGCRPSGIV